MKLFDPKRISRPVVGLAALLLSTTPLLAQEQGKHLTLAGIPSALTAQHKTAFAGLALTNKASANSNRNDGSAVVGFALGSAEKNIGFQLTANIVSLQSDFADSGYFSLKASRRIVAGDAPIYASIDVGYLGAWGDSKIRDETATIAFTRFSNLQLGQDSFPIMMTLGAGTDLRKGNSKPAVFFGAGMGISKNFAISAAYTGESVTLGTGFKIEQLPNTNFGLSLDDAFNDLGERRLIFTVGVSFNKLFGG